MSYDDDEFIPPGAKHPKGNTLSTFQNLRPILVGLEQTKLIVFLFCFNHSYSPYLHNVEILWE